MISPGVTDPSHPSQQQIPRPEHRPADDGPLEGALRHPLSQPPSGERSDDDGRHQQNIHPQRGRGDQPQPRRDGDFGQVDDGEEPCRGTEERLDREPRREQVHGHHRSSGVRDHRGEPAERAVAEPCTLAVAGSGLSPSRTRPRAPPPLPQGEADDEQEDHSDRPPHCGVVCEPQKEPAQHESRDDGGNEADERPPVGVPAIDDQREDVAHDEQQQKCARRGFGREDSREDGDRYGVDPGQRRLRYPDQRGRDCEERPGAEGEVR